ncbi:MAG TPA: helix-turn-helix transcriptional regulator [Candidatus Limiplasma sp.]|nr:helix-turn-helix transcriptional regulator [Candidatus Limiplasma sp.]
MKTPNERIRGLRNEKGLIQPDIANVLGCSPATISYYENGRPLTQDVIATYCQYFHVSADWLLGLTTDRHPGGSELSAKVETLAALTDASGGEPLTADQLNALLDVFILYYRHGAPAGNVPVSVLSEFLSRMGQAVAALMGNETAPILTATNAVGSAGLDAQNMLAAWLTHNAAK